MSQSRSHPLCFSWKVTDATDLAGPSVEPCSLSEKVLGSVYDDNPGVRVSGHSKLKSESNPGANFSRASGISRSDILTLDTVLVGMVDEFHNRPTE
jgi:hypothetical protein